MYLISIYFDEKTDKRIRNIMKQVAKETGNYFMTENDIPPHITVAAMETRDEDRAIEILDQCINHLQQGDIHIVSLGAFLPQVIYLEPVLDEYLHTLSVMLNDALKMLPDTKISTQYQPFGWLPHITMGKQLSEVQMRQAFEVLQKKFVPISGRVTKIGIAKPNPHRDLKVWDCCRT